MYGIYPYIHQKNQPNVGKYTIHGWYGLCFFLPFRKVAILSRVKMPCDLQTPKVLVNDFEEASSIDMKEAQSDMDASVEKLGKLWLVNLRPPNEPPPQK